MPLSRRTFLLASAGAVACSHGDPRLQRAAQYLWSKQDKDGGWHSEVYGLLRSGQSLTPFVLDALLDVPVSVEAAPAGAVDRAVAFIQRSVNRDGLVGITESGLDYPNYATGLAVRALCRVKTSGWEAMLAALRLQQFTEQNGWHRDDPPYGAWGMGGQIRTPSDAGHVDLAMTRYVLEGISAAGVRPPDEALAKALVYIERCQNPDGGFFFSTVEADINKAGEDSSRDSNTTRKGGGSGCFRSYGSTTADGILALRAAGVPNDDPRLIKGIKWLREHHKYNSVPGFEDTARATWATGLRYYYAGAISSAIPELAVLLPEQRPDGSWANQNNIVKEDDPLIATAFAVRCLCRGSASMGSG
jgi:Prenyltransferase and squalene oxidase repeat